MNEAGQGRGAFWHTTARRIARTLIPTRPQLAASPLRRLGLALVVVAAAAIIAPRGFRWIAIFVAFSAYSIGDPLINAFKPRWWVNTGKSLVGFVALFAVAAVLSEMDKLGEAGMLFVAPMMAYPFALGVSGLIRLLRWMPP